MKMEEEKRGSMGQAPKSLMLWSHLASCSSLTAFPLSFLCSSNSQPLSSVVHIEIPYHFMGRASTRLPSFCLSHIATRVQVRSPPIEPNPPTIEPGQGAEISGGGEKDSSKRDEQEAAVASRRVVIVVESSAEAKCALQWALTHAVQSSDIVVLLEVVKPPPSKNGDQESQKERDPKDYELLNAMKSTCQAKRPEVQVELSLVEGKDRGPAIVDEARKQGASLLILGQKRRSITWRLLMMWAGSRIDGGIADYCVQNATCMALAVRRKSRRGGGYLITTRRHKDFWLLA